MFIIGSISLHIPRAAVTQYKYFCYTKLLRDTVEINNLFVIEHRSEQLSNNHSSTYILCLLPASVCPPPEGMSGGF